MSQPNTDPNAPGKRSLTTFQRTFLGLLLAALVVSVGWRAYAISSRSSSDATPGMHAASFVGTEGAQGEPAPEGFERLLPYITEGSFFGIIGFALGYASRKFMKVGLIAIAILFIGVQLLVSSGYVAVDWLGVRSEVNQLIFNIKENETITSFLTHKVPSVGALFLGCVLGFKRG